MPAHNVYYRTMLSLITDGSGNVEASGRRLSYVFGLPVAGDRIFAVKVSSSIDRPVIFIPSRDEIAAGYEAVYPMTLIHASTFCI